MSAKDDRVCVLNGSHSICFVNFSERQLFSHFLKLLAPKGVVTSSDGEWLEGSGHRVAHRVEMVSMLGLRSEAVVHLCLRCRGVAVSKTYYEVKY